MLVFSRLKWCLVSVCSLALVACGGGGSAAGDPLLGTGGSTGTPGSPTISLSLSSSTVTSATPAVATATVRSSGGVPLVGQVVSFSSSGSLGSFSPSSALTDSNGQAVVSLSPATASTNGADTAVATTVVGTATLTASTGFQLSATNVSIASFTSDLATLGQYGQTTLTVTLTGSTPAVPVGLTVTSACVTKGLATLTPLSTTTTTGSATFTYRDQGCGSVDAVDGLQATINGTAITASLALTLTAPAVSSIAFVSATPDTIYLRGTGLTENSNVVFQVRDAAGLGVRERNVVLELTTLAGGLTMDDVQTPVTKKSDSNGNVTVRVNAGTVPTPVRVKATLEGTAISTVSSNLAVAVGLPSQNNFSLSQQALNIEGYDRDGTTNSFTVIASDRLGNPVPDNTAINLVTSGGQVQSIVFTARGTGDSNNRLSVASAQYQSSNPRPLDGRIVTLAYALGEESFLDTNGNNVYDAGEDYQDLGDVFLDRLLNRSYNPLEDQYISLGLGGTDPCNTATSSLLRLDRSVPSRTVTPSGAAQNTCAAGWGRAYVRRAAQTVLSTSSANPSYGTSLPPGAFVPAGSVCPSPVSLIAPAPAYASDDTASYVAVYPFGSVGRQNVGKTGTLALYASDANPVAFNPVAAGTLVTAAGTDGLTVQVVGGSPVASSLVPQGVAINYSFGDTAVSGVVTVTFTSPSGLRSSFSQTLVKDAATGVVTCP